MKAWSFYRGLNRQVPPRCPNTKFWPSRTQGCRFFTSTVARQISLRPYQEESIQAVLSHLGSGHKRLGISLATGAGKTVIFSQLIGRIQPENEKAARTLILVHRRELVEQAYRHCAQAYPDLIVEVDMANMHASGSADITVASVLSLTRGRLEKYDPARYKLVLVDEAHHMVSRSYLAILSHFGLVDESRARKEIFPTEEDASSSDGREVRTDAPLDLQDKPALVGVSATLSRFDGLSLGHAIDHIVYHKDYIDLIGEKWLANVVFTTVDSKADLSKVKTYSDGDFMPGSLSRAMNTEVTNDIVVGTWLHKAKERRSTMVFCVDVAHVKGLEESFLRHGIDARSVTASASISVRSATVRAFKEGKFPVLLNCGIFTEGTDIPNIDCVLLARPTKSRNLLVQMIGRGMRLHPDKKDCHVIDMVSALRTGIVTVPTLFGLDPTVLLEEADVSEVEARRRELPEEVEHSSGFESPTKSSGEMTFKDYSSVAELLEDTSDEAHVRQISANAWVYIGVDSHGNDRHYLAGTDSAYLTINDSAQRQPRYQVLLTAKVPFFMQEGNKWRGYRRPELIASSQTFSDAVHAADTYAAHNDRFPRTLTERRQPWRRRPATEEQVAYLKKRLILDEDAKPEEFTKGQCMDMITKVKHGAKGRFKAIESHKATTRRGKAKEERDKVMKEREVVKVGPLSQRTFPE